MNLNLKLSSMKRSSLSLSAVLAVVSVLPGAQLLAQVTEVARTPISDLSKLAFGYYCDDKFVVRNDGDKAVDLAYAIEKGNEHTKLSLNAHELVELSSTSKDAMKLWLDGKLVAKAPTEKRSCKDVQGNGAVTITPFEVSERSTSRSAAGVGFGYGYGPYGLYDPWGMSFYSRFGAWGGYPYYSTIVRVPVMAGGNRGGARGGGRR